MLNDYASAIPGYLTSDPLFGSEPFAHSHLIDTFWQKWNQEVRQFLVTRQHKTGPLAGSWDPTGPWSEAGGRVLSTCLATLTLEVYYRYLPLYWRAERRSPQE